jgi:xylan 1,4-beta-xylosidase
VRGPLRLLGLLACLALVASCSSPARQPAVKPAAAHTIAMTADVRSVAVTSGGGVRPAFDRDFPDPSVIATGGRYYAFATHTAWETPGHVFPILVSSDLDNWKYVADVFSAPPTWGRGDWWAPAVVAVGSQYVLYYSGLAPSGVHCLAVATAGSPTGPYTDHGPIACRDGASAVGYIDAAPLVAAGKAYLYFSVDGPNHHSISVLPLSADMLHLAGARVELIGVTQSWEKIGDPTVEGPSVFAWGSLYVMLYSGGSWRGQYGMGFALASSPLGPFVKSDHLLLSNGGALRGPGGGSFFLDTTGTPWLAYHAWVRDSRDLYLNRLSIS